MSTPINWSDIEFLPAVDERPVLSHGFISFIDKDGASKYIPLTIPEGAYQALCLWENEHDDELFLAYRQYWYSVKARLKESVYGCTKLYNIYLPKPKEA